MKRILFVNPFGIGDALFTLTVAEAVRKKIPGIEIGFLCNERTQELLRMSSTVAYVHEFDRDRIRKARSESLIRHLKEYRMLLNKIAEKKYDAMIDLSLGREFSFLGFLARIPRRIGFDYRGRGFFLNEKTPFVGYENIPVVESQMELVESLGVEIAKKFEPPLFHISVEAQKKADFFLQGESGIIEGPYFAVAPGGGKSWGSNAIYKQWEPEKFIAVVNSRPCGDDSTALLVGEESERSLLSAVYRGLTVPAKIACGENIAVVAALLKKTKVLLGNDGGLVHLAHAFKVPTASIFGPVDEKVYGPFGEHTPHETVSEAVPCRPCYSRFNFPPCLHNKRCLDQLSVEKVLVALKKIT